MACLPTGRHGSGAGERLLEGSWTPAATSTMNGLMIFGPGAGPVQEHVIDEFVAGRLSRRDFIRRGSAGRPVDAAARRHPGRMRQLGHRRVSSGSGAGQASADIKAGILTPVGGDQPDHHRRPGRPGADRQRRRVPGLHRPGGRLPPVAGDELERQLRRLGVDVQDPPGGEVQRRHADDGRRRGLQLQDPVRSEEQRANALSQFGGFLTPDGVQKVDDQTVAFHLDGPEQRLRGRGVRGQLQHGRRAEGLRLRQLSEEVPRHRPVHDDAATRPTSGRHTSGTLTTRGRQGAALQDRLDFYAPRSADGGRAPGGLDRLHGPVLGRYQPAAADRGLQRDQPEGGGPSRALDAQRCRAFHEQARTSGGRLYAGPSRHRGRAVQGPGSGGE